MDGATIVEDEVRELIRRRGLDPTRDPAGVRRLVEDAVADYDDRSLSGSLPPLPDPPGTVKSVLDSVAGLGPLQRYLDDPDIEEIWINEPEKVFVARHGQSELTTTILTGDQVRDLVERMLKASGRRVDLSSPFVDATLVDGSRLHVVIPDITREHWAVNSGEYRCAPCDEPVAHSGRLTGPGVGLATHVSDVVNHVLYEDLEGIVLLGFSYGGYVVTGAVDHIASRIRHLVYLDAFVPDDGESVFSLTGRAGGLMNLNDPWLVPPPARDFDDPAEAAFMNARRTPHPIGCFSEAVRLARAIEGYSFTRTYIRSGQRQIGLTLQGRLRSTQLPSAHGTQRIGATSRSLRTT